MSPDVQKIIFIGLGCLFIAAIVLWEVKEKNWRGVFACALAIIAGAIASFDEILGFDGEILALVFAVVAATLFFAGKKILSFRKKSQSARPAAKDERGKSQEKGPPNSSF